MKQINGVVALLMMAFMLGCAGTASHGFREPTSNDTMLIIGSVILQDNYYTEETAVYKKGIEVAIYGKSQDGANQAFWTTTDENGYFAIADVPKGEYALKGIRHLIGKGSYVTVENRLRVSSDVYMLTTSTSIIFQGDYFAFEPKDRIASLQHNIFELDRMSKSTRRVNYLVKNQLENLTLVNGETVSAGPVEEYFVRKYPQSAWVPFLEQVATIIRFRR